MCRYHSRSEVRRHKQQLLGLGSLLTQRLVCVLLLSFPLVAEGRQEVVRLNGGLVVAEGVSRRHERRVKVHEDRARAEYDIAVTFPVHAGGVTEAEHATLAVTESVGVVWRGGWRGEARHHVPPARQARSLFSLQLGLGRQSGVLQHRLLPQVTVSPPARRALLLVDFREPSEQLVRVALRHGGIGKERVPRLRLSGYDGPARLLC